MDQNCIFCKLANGFFGSATIYEDDMFRVILDIAPAAKGHMLILPKEHYADLFSCDEAVAARLMPLAKRLCLAAQKVFACDGVNILQNNRPAAWQSVYHLHMHIIPRYENDGVRFPWTALSYADGEAEETAKRLAEALAACQVS